MSHSRKSSRVPATVPVMLSSIVLADEDGQVYGKVIRALGNRRFECRCADNITRVVTIRGTFRKRKKHIHRDTFVKVGMWVLVSIREGLNKGEKGDIIHMYSDSEVSVLKQYQLIKDMDDRSNADDEDDLIFTNLYDNIDPIEVPALIPQVRCPIAPIQVPEQNVSVWQEDDDDVVQPIYGKKELETIDLSLI